MTTLAATPAWPPAALRDEFLRRQPALAIYGAALLALAVVAVIALQLDPRRIGETGVWTKPAKFLGSIGIFSLTAAWFFGYIAPQRRRAPLMIATIAVLLVAGSFELVYIGWQGWRGEASHWNLTTPFHARMYQLMGIGAVLLVATTLPLAWQIARHPARGLRPDFVAAVVIGLVLTFALGGGLGGYMSAQSGHAVGPEGAGLPIVGWNRLGGDLRVAHFMGMHAQQAIVLLALAVAGLATRARWTLIIGGAVCYMFVTIALWLQAVAGKPLFPL